MYQHLDVFSEEERSSLLHGFLFSHNYRNEDLGRMMRVQANTVSRWKHRKRRLLNQRRNEIISLVKTHNDDIKQLIDLCSKVKNSLFFEGTFLDKNKAIQRSKLEGKLITRKSNEIFLNTSLLFPNFYKGKEIKFLFLNRKEFV